MLLIARPVKKVVSVLQTTFLYGAPLTDLTLIHNAPVKMTKEISIYVGKEAHFNTRLCNHGKETQGVSTPKSVCPLGNWRTITHTIVTPENRLILLLHQDPCDGGHRHTVFTFMQITSYTPCSMQSYLTRHSYK